MPAINQDTAAVHVDVGTLLPAHPLSVGPSIFQSIPVRSDWPLLEQLDAVEGTC